MRKFCEDLKEHASKIINYEKKEIISLTYKGNKLYRNQKSLSDKNVKQSKIIVILLVNIEELLMMFAI